MQADVRYGVQAIKRFLLEQKKRATGEQLYRRFGVDERRVREWRKLKGRNGGERKTVLRADKEEQLVSWII